MTLSGLALASASSSTRRRSRSRTSTRISRSGKKPGRAVRRRDARGHAAAVPRDAVHPRRVRPVVLHGRHQPRAVSAARAGGRLLDDRVVSCSRARSCRCSRCGSSARESAPAQRPSEPRRGVFARLRRPVRAHRRGALVRGRWLVLARVRRSCACRRSFSSRGSARELFPRVDTGQFQLRIRAPRERASSAPWTSCAASTRPSATRSAHDHVRITLANIGNRRRGPIPVNAVYVFNSGPQEAVLLVALSPRTRRSRAPLDVAPGAPAHAARASATPACTSRSRPATSSRRS